MGDTNGCPCPPAIRDEVRDHTCGIGGNYNSTWHNVPPTIEERIKRLEDKVR